MDKDPFADCPNEEYKPVSVKVNKKNKKKMAKKEKDL